MDLKQEICYTSSPETPHIERGTALDKNISSILSFLESPLAPSEDADLPDTQPVHILKGVVAYVEVRTGTENRSKAVCRELLNMGASVEPKFTNDVTHVVFKDGKKSTMDRAVKRGIFMVSVLWVDSCKQNQEHVSESLFPAAQPETKGTPIMVARLKKSKSMQPKDFDEEVANSAEKNVKNRKRLASKVEREERYRMILESPIMLHQRRGGTPTLTSKSSYLVSETCPRSPEQPSIHYSITVPDTPPSMRERLNDIKARQQLTEPPSSQIRVSYVDEDDEPITDTPHIDVVEDDIAVLQRRLFGTSEAAVDTEDPLMLSTSSTRHSPVSVSIQQATTSPYVKSLISSRGTHTNNKESPAVGRQICRESVKVNSQSPRITDSASQNSGTTRPENKISKISISHGIKKQNKNRRSRDSKEMNVTILEAPGMGKNEARKASGRISSGNKENEALEKIKSVKKKRLMKISVESPCSQLMAPSDIGFDTEVERDEDSFLQGKKDRRKVKAKKKDKKSGSSRDPKVLFTGKEIPEKPSKNVGKKRKQRRSSSLLGMDRHGNNEDGEDMPKKRNKRSLNDSEISDNDDDKVSTTDSPEKGDIPNSKADVLVPESVEVDDTFVPESMDMVEGLTYVADSEEPDCDQVTVVPETVPDDYPSLDEDELSPVSPPTVHKGRRKSHSGQKVHKILPVRGRRRSEILKKSILCENPEKDENRKCDRSSEGRKSTGNNSQIESQPQELGEVETPKASALTKRHSDSTSGVQRRKSCINVTNSNNSCTFSRRKSVFFSDTLNTDMEKEPLKGRRKSIQRDINKINDKPEQEGPQNKKSQPVQKRKSESVLYKSQESKTEKTIAQDPSLTSKAKSNRRSSMFSIDKANTSAEKKDRRRSSIATVNKVSDTDAEGSTKKNKRQSVGRSAKSPSQLPQDLKSVSNKIKPIGSKDRRLLSKSVTRESPVFKSLDASPEIALQAPLQKKITVASNRRRSVRFMQAPETQKSSISDLEESLTDVSALTTQNHTLTPSGRTKQLVPALGNRRRSGRLLLQAAKRSDTSVEGDLEESLESVEEPRLASTGSTPGRSLNEGLSTEEIAAPHEDTTEETGMLSTMCAFSQGQKSTFANLTSSRRSIEEFVTVGKKNLKKTKPKPRACSLPLVNNESHGKTQKRRRSGSLTQRNKEKGSERKGGAVGRLHKSESDARSKNDNLNNWKKVSIESKSNSEAKRTLITTNLHFDEQDLVTSVVKRLGGFIVEETVSPSTSHVVSGRNRRTLNILYAMAKGLWVISLEWVFKSLEAGRWLSEEDYEVNYFPAIKLNRVERGLDGAKYCPNLFTEEKGIYVAEQTTPPRKHLVKLIKLCGGKVVSSQRQASVCIGTVSTEDLLSLSEQWLLDSICQMSTVNHYAYKLNCPTRMEREPSPDY